MEVYDFWQQEDSAHIICGFTIIEYIQCFCSRQELRALSNETCSLAQLEPCNDMRWKWQVMVVNESLLWGTEAPICQPHLLHKELCCLSETQIKDVEERLLRLLWY